MPLHTPPPAPKRLLTIEATPDSHWYGVCFERAIPMLADRLA